VPDAPELIDHDRDAEMALLGSMLLDNEVADDVVGQVTEDVFYLDPHRLVFQSIERLRAERIPIDLVTVTNDMTTAGTLPRAGGASYISALGNSVPTSQNAASYLRIVKQKAAMRAFLQGTQRAAALVAQTGDVAGGAALLREALAVAESETAATVAAEAKAYSFEVSTAADPEHLLSRYIGWASSLTDSPVEYHELSGITLLSMALHSVKAILGPHPDGLQANLYGLVIGDPGKSRKTTATGFARRIAEDFLPDSTVSNWHSPE
jgi:replicative DNA helicase